MKKIEKRPPKKNFFIFLGAFLLILLLTSGAIFFFTWKLNANKINPGTSVGPILVGNLTIGEAQQLIEKNLQAWEQSRLVVRHNDTRLEIPAAIQVNVEASLPIFTWQPELINQFLTNNLAANSWQRYLVSYFTPAHLDIPYFLDEALLKSYLTEALPDLTITPQDASFIVHEDLSTDWEFTIRPEQIGRQINFETALKTIHKNLATLSNEEAVLTTKLVRPQVYQADLENLRPAAQALINQGGLTLTVAADAETATSTWIVPKSTVATWIVPKFNNQSQTVGLDSKKIAAYLNELVAPDINREPQAPRYELAENRLTDWSPAVIGKKLDTEKSVTDILENYLENKITETELSVNLILPEIKSGDNPLRIEELIGTGHSNFSGSSKNRRHNIKVGADTLHGLLIAPGEEFSLIKALGDMDASGGYLPEYVIKGDKTQLEYGGGLCQVATTIFRSALGSGLPITMRQNHSYRVSYYEPAGMDAAIYDPLPDVRFINDSPDYILIQARIDGDDLYFDFWGKEDGREATTTTPVIFNIVKPAPTKIIETTDLKPGEKRCTESSHNGADTYFDYTVIYPDGEEKVKRFKSHYVPWQAVCLVGVDPEAKAEEAEQTEAETDSSNTASSTPETETKPE
ncbi:MAG: VanW family protein [Patescibacteria group bacterium]|jgi:vancomycin resistance protein YoaR